MFFWKKLNWKNLKAKKTLEVNETKIYAQRAHTRKERIFLKENKAKRGRKQRKKRRGRKQRK